MEYNKTFSVTSYGNFCPFDFGFFTTIMVLFKLLLAALSAGCIFTSSGSIIEYSTVTGYFLQDVNTTNPGSFDFVSMLADASDFCVPLIRKSS